MSQSPLVPCVSHNRAQPLPHTYLAKIIQKVEWSISVILLLYFWNCSRFIAFFVIAWLSAFWVFWHLHVHFTDAAMHFPFSFRFPFTYLHINEIVCFCIFAHAFEYILKNWCKHQWKRNRIVAHSKMCGKLNVQYAHYCLLFDLVLFACN